MKADIKITKMIDGTYKAWTKRKRVEVHEYTVIVDADGKTAIEAESNLKAKLAEQASKTLKRKFEEA